MTIKLSPSAKTVGAFVAAAIAPAPEKKETKATNAYDFFVQQYLYEEDPTKRKVALTRLREDYNGPCFIEPQDGKPWFLWWLSGDMEKGKISVVDLADSKTKQIIFSTAVTDLPVTKALGEFPTIDRIQQKLGNKVLIVSLTSPTEVLDNDGSSIIGDGSFLTQRSDLAKYIKFDKNNPKVIAHIFFSTTDHSFVDIREALKAKEEQKNYTHLKRLKTLF